MTSHREVTTAPNGYSYDQPAGNHQTDNQAPLMRDGDDTRRPWAPAETAEPVRNSPGFMWLFQRNWHATITYCSVFWSFGMCVALLGPTLLDLGCLTASDMKTISWVFLAQLLCSLIGSITAGILANSVDSNLLLFVATAVIPVAMFFIPFCTVLTALGIVLAIMGLNMGCIDCLANLQMIQMYGEHVSPFLQAMHFCYGFGAFVSPMIAEPFLLNEDCSPLIDNTSYPTPPPLTPWLNQSQVAETLEQAQSRTHVRYAFWIMAALQVPIPGLVLSLLMRMRRSAWRPGHTLFGNSDSCNSINTKVVNQRDYEDIDKTERPPPTPFWKVAAAQNQYGRRTQCFGSTTQEVVTIAATTALITFIYDGLQSAFGGYVYAFAVKSIVGLNKTEGAYLNACFWGSFAIGRLMSVIFATKFTPAFMLLCNIFGCLSSQLLMLSLQHDHGALYVGTFFFGLSLSSITPTALSLAEQYIDVTPSITTCIVVFAAVGEMLFPVIVGNIFVSMGPASFLAFGTVVCFLSLFVYVFLWVMGKNTAKQKAVHGTSKSFVWLLCCFTNTGAVDDNEFSQMNGCRTSNLSVFPAGAGSAPGYSEPPRHQTSFELGRVGSTEADGFR